MKRVAHMIVVATLLGVALAGSQAKERENMTDPRKQAKEDGRRTARNLDWSTSAKPEWHTGPMNMYVRGIQLIVNNRLAQQGEDPIPYETISGDLGVAFTFHASEIEVEAPGYWPVEPICLGRLNFLNRTVGYRLNHYNLPNDAEGMKNPEKCYQTWFEPQVRSCIDARKPCLLTLCPELYLVTGYNTSNASFQGIPIGGDEKTGSFHVKRMPWKMVLPDKPTKRLARDAADLQALSYAIDLHHDRNKDLSYWRRYTGLKALRLWIRVLSDDKKPHARLGHQYARDHLLWNRLTAIRYLQAIQSRHNESVAQHLGNAIKHYEGVVSQVRSLELDKKEHFQPAKRAETVTGIERIMELESQAVAELQKAVDAFPDNLKNRRPVTGRCYCGKIEYEAVVKEFRFTECSCAACRQATGGMQTSNVDVKPDDFKITSGEPVAYKADTGAACAKGTWHFCDKCGCSLFWTSPDGKLVAIFAGTLDDANIFRKKE